MSLSRFSDLIGIAALAGVAGAGLLIYKNKKGITDFFGGIGSGVNNAVSGIGDFFTTLTNSVPKVSTETLLIVGDRGITGKPFIPDSTDPLYEVSQAIKALPTSESVAAATNGAVADTPVESKSIDLLEEIKQAIKALPTSESVAAAATTKAADAATPIRSAESEPVSTPVYSTQTEKILAEKNPGILEYLKDPEPVEQDPEKEKKLNAILPKALRKAGTAGIITALRKGLI